MGTGTTATDDERRWAEAEAILNGTQDQWVHRRTRRRRSKVLAMAIGFPALCVLGAVVGFLAAGRGADSGPESQSSSGPLWAEIVGLIIIVLGLLVVVRGFVQARRAGQWGARWKAPTSVLNRRQKRDLRRQVVAGVPDDAAHLPLARDLARRMTQTRWLLWIFSGFSILQLGSVIVSPSPWRFGVTGLVVLSFAICAAMAEREARYARRFLLS
jgi:hypothetical protein